MQKIININFNKESLKDVMRNHIGRDNGLTRSQLMNTLLPDYSTRPALEQYYFQHELTRMITTARKENFFIVTKESMLFVPTDLSDLSEYHDRINSNIKSMKNNKKKSEVFVATEQWRNI